LLLRPTGYLTLTVFSPVLEEVDEDLAAVGFEDAADDLEAMVGADGVDVDE
jgi:hypothetical protein